MRRLTRRIGLFGPGAAVRAAGVGKGKRPEPESASGSRAEVPAGTASQEPQKESWLKRLLGWRSKADD